MLNIHVLTAGENIHKVYQQVFPHYKVSNFILLAETEQPDRIKASIAKMQAGCREINVPLEIITIENNNIPQLMEEIIGIRKRYPIKEAQLFFNVTSGRKDIAIMTFIASLWISGIGYYLPSETNVYQEPLVLPAPRIPLSKLESNKLHQRILYELSKKTDIICQADLVRIIKTNPNRNGKALSGQALSPSVETLVEAGLVHRQQIGSKNDLSLTLAGRVAVSVLKSVPVTHEF